MSIAAIGGLGVQHPLVQPSTTPLRPPQTPAVSAPTDSDGDRDGTGSSRALTYAPDVTDRGRRPARAAAAAGRRVRHPRRPRA